jgi:hypothetical protein
MLCGNFANAVVAVSNPARVLIREGLTGKIADMDNRSFSGWSLLLASSVLALASFRVASAEDAPELRDVVAVLRVSNIINLNDKVEQILKELNPHTALRDPVKNLVGAMLRNKTLAELPDKAFLEVLQFSPRVIKDAGLVLAFPVTDGEQYRSVLTSEAAIRTKGVSDDISTLKEELPGETRTLYFAVTQNQVAIFGESFEAVKRSRDIYQSARRGILRQGKQDVRIRIDLRQLTSLNENKIRDELDRLREDIAKDFLGDSFKLEKPFNLALRQGLTVLSGLAMQLATLETDISLNADSLEIQLDLTPVTGQSLAFTLGNARKGIPTLGASLPRESVAFLTSFVWPEYWAELVQGAGGIASVAFGSAISHDVQEDMQALLEMFRQADPQEMACSVIPPTDQYPLPVRVKLLRWANAYKLDVALKRVGDVLRAEPLSEMLEQNGLKLYFDKKMQAARHGNISIDHYRLGLQPLGENTGGNDEFLSASPRDYLVARTGQTLAIVTGQAFPGDTDLKIPERELATMRQTLDLLAGAPGAEKNVLYLRTAKKADSETIGFFTLQPLQYIDMAFRSLAVSQPENYGGMYKYVEEFAVFNQDDPPVEALLKTTGGKVRASLVIPRKTLQALSHACLGISGILPADIKR